jgi:hypothetical protein
MAESIKSLYKPEYPNKYKGNPNNIICRSSWERKFCRWCDLNENILEWGSEEFFIPYFDPTTNRIRRYFPDFIIKVREQTGEIKKYVIEVKPKRQTIPPVQTSKKRTRTYITEVKTYAMNQAKWEAAKEWCKDRMIEFRIITENELGIK